LYRIPPKRLKPTHKQSTPACAMHGATERMRPAISRQSVEFKLGFLNRDMERVVEPGTFKIMLGGNSVDLQNVTLAVVAR
jgi:hypothetical protein